MRLNTFFVALAITLVSVVLIVSATLIYVTDSLDAAAGNILQASESIYYCQDMRRELGELRADGANELRHHPAYERLNLLAKKAEEFVGSPQEAKDLERLKAELAALPNSTEDESVKYAEIDRLVTALLATNREQANQFYRDIRRQNRTSNYLGAVAMIGTALLAAAVILGVRRLFIAPLSHLRTALVDFSHGRRASIKSDGSIREISEIQQTFNQMVELIKRQHRQQFEFISGVAHDLRNPLNNLSLSIGLLGHEQLDDRKELTSLCCRQIDHLNNLLENLLDQSRMEAGALALKLDTYDLSAIVNEAVAFYRGRSPIHTISAFIPDNGVFVHCDRDRMYQVLHNLLSNAVKYSPAGGSIDITLQAANSTSTLSIKDSGIGIESAELEDIFKPFHRIASSATIARGTGMGLSVVKTIVESHGGRITVNSERGKGSEFLVEFPIVTPQKPAELHQLRTASVS